MTNIDKKTFDEERALYAACDVLVKGCKFDGPADGESAFKEAKLVWMPVQLAVLKAGLNVSPKPALQERYLRTA